MRKIILFILCVCTVLISCQNGSTIENSSTISDSVSIMVQEKQFSIADSMAIGNIRIGCSKAEFEIAKKEFLPSFNINGIYSMDTASGGNFFSWNSSFGLLIAGLTQDLFKGGAKIANLKIKKAKYFELFEKYKQADLNAIKEVNNALNLINQDTISENSAKEQMGLQNAIYNSSKNKLKQGTISKLKYYEDKSTLNTIEQLWASSKTARLVDYITLYKALGGQL